MHNILKSTPQDKSVKSRTAYHVIGCRLTTILAIRGIRKPPLKIWNRFDRIKIPKSIIICLSPFYVAPPDPVPVSGRGGRAYFLPKVETGLAIYP